MAVSPQIQAFFHEGTNTVTYLVADPETQNAAVIDPVLDYDQRSGKVATQSADAVLDAALEKGLTIKWVLETHAHADHLSAAPHIKKHTDAQLAISSHITEVQKIFSKVFNLNDISQDGSEFDLLLDDGDTLSIGQLTVHAMHTPGHTPACMAYRIQDAVFVGDTIFMPDYGTARADFPGGDAQALYRSIQKLLALPPETRLFLCHDYKTEDRDTYAWETTVADQRAHNIHVREGITEQQFVEMRTQRDASLPAPNLLLPSIQVNIRAGRFPEPESNGTRYLKIPLRF